jgi:hypothetical protein
VPRRSNAGASFFSFSLVVVVFCAGPYSLFPRRGADATPPPSLALILTPLSPLFHGQNNKNKPTQVGTGAAAVCKCADPLAAPGSNGFCVCGGGSLLSGGKCTCPAGSVLDNGVCKCDVGYISGTGKSPCTQCPPGSTTSSTGQTVCSTCVDASLVYNAALGKCICAREGEFFNPTTQQCELPDTYGASCITTQSLCGICVKNCGDDATVVCDAFDLTKKGCTQNDISATGGGGRCAGNVVCCVPTSPSPAPFPKLADGTCPPVPIPPPAPAGRR